MGGAEVDGSRIRERQGDELTEGGRRFRELFARSRDGFVVLDAHGRFLDANPAYCAMVGYSLEELRALPSFLTITPERWHPWETQEILGERQLDGGISKVYEKEYIRKDGTVFPVEVQVYAVRHGDGSLDCLWEIARDITERRRAEQALRESEERWRALFEASPMGIYLYRLDEAGRLIFEAGNPAADRLTGADSSQFAGKAIEEAFPPLVEAGIPDRYRRVARDGERWHTDEVAYEDERIRGAFEVYAFQIAPNRMAVVFEDITDRKRAEEALRRQTEEMERYFSRSLDLLCIADTRGRFIRLNPEWERVLGYPVSELEGRAFLDLVHPDDREATLEAVSRLAAQEDVLSFENRYRCQDGTYRWIEWRSTPVGATIYAAARDVTDRKRLEAALRESEELQRTIIDASPLAIISVDLERRVRSWNAAAERMFGWTASEVLGRPLPYLGDGNEEWAREAHEMMDRVLAGETLSRVEVARPRKDGTLIHVSLSTAPVRDRSGQVTALMACMEDITDRKRIEEALRRTQFAMDHAPDSILWVGENGEITYANDAACASMGYTPEELLSLTVFDIDPDFPREEWADHAARMEREGTMRFESRHRTKDGRVFPVEVSSNYIPFAGRFNAVAFDRDISERRRAEEEQERLRSQLVQAQKMESVGRLAGGVAHDFNNMLGVILGHAELALQQVDPSQELAASLREIRKAAERSADLTRQLLAFARKQTVAPRVIDLNEAVGAMLSMLRRLIGEDIALVWVPCPGPCLVNIDPSQIDQVLANLCVNARDAIGGTGQVTIETATMAPGEAYSSEIGSFAPGEYVLLSVTDNGCGIDAEARSHLFEPFFTTKGVGEGTGLGLATVYGIVRQNEGFINVDSEPGQGTTFRIYLPRHPGEVGSSADEDAAGPASGGPETILLVEDEPTVLELVKTMLEGRGYTVLAAGTPSEGLRLAQEHTGDIELLITDVIMPEMNGLELAQRLRAIHPGLRWLFMSGYPAGTIAHHGVLNPDVCFIEKPFRADALAAKVREALGRDGG